MREPRAADRRMPHKEVYGGEPDETLGESAPEMV